MAEVDGEHRDPVARATEMRAKYPSIDVLRRYFLDHTVVHNGKTWVLSNQWGTKTEPTLSALADAPSQKPMSPFEKLTRHPADQDHDLRLGTYRARLWFPAVECARARNACCATGAWTRRDR